MQYLEARRNSTNRLKIGQYMRNAESDIVFDGMADTFAKEIYGTTKGDVRLHLLWHDLLAQLPAASRGNLQVIDVGAGMGQIAGRIAALGHEVTLCDPSRDMLEKAYASIHEAGLSDQTHFVCSTVQELAGKIVEQFDIVICHAVLEWLAEPEKTLSSILSLLKPKGHLSLMFYNRNAAVLKRALKGDFLGALEKSRVVPEDGQKPTPLDPDTVQSWLSGSGLRIVSKAGIRIFHDHLPESSKTPGELEKLLEFETEFSRREPFASLAQHIHVMCRRR